MLRREISSRAWGKIPVQGAWKRIVRGALQKAGRQQESLVRAGGHTPLEKDDSPAKGVILIPVFSISNGTRSSMMCHLNSGT